MQVVPKVSRGQVPHSIQIVVGHHFRFTRGAGGEIHQHGVVIGIHEGWTLELRCLAPFRLPVVETLRDGLAVVGNGDILLHRGTVGLGSLDLTHHVGIVHADDGFHRGAGVTIDDVFLRQHVGGRNDDGTNLVQGQHHYPPFVAAL